MRRAVRLAMALAILPLCAAAQTGLVQTLEENEAAMTPPPMGNQAGLDAWIAAFRPRALAAGITAPVFDATLRGVRFDPAIVEKDRNQNEFTKTVWDYLDTAVSDDRIALGQKALAANKDLLAKIEAEYDVDASVIVAVWGLESAYGTFRGKLPVIASLATLAYDGRRADFFEGELIAALKILAEGHTTPDKFIGSWAGASGHTQFMPSSWASFAVDFDGDGRRDIWSDDPADALASTANYLRYWGWTRGQPWGLEITLPRDFDYDQTTAAVTKSVAEWQAMGIRPMAGGDLPDHGRASVLLPGGSRGAAFLIFSNFQVIERYNTADAYVIGIGHLADRIAGGPPIRASWPREWRALTLPERRDLQDRLTRAGFDAGGVDGRIGPKTISAVKAFQKSLGRVPDGYPSPDLLALLQN
ncbi:MAG: lytic murein transglycosylase [Pseudomonadota bacterium]